MDIDTLAERTERLAQRKAVDDAAAAQLKPGDYVIFWHETEGNRIPGRNYTASNPPHLRARVVEIHDLETITLQPFHEPNGLLPDEPGFSPVDRGPPRRVSRYSGDGPRHNTWEMVF